MTRLKKDFHETKEIFLLFSYRGMPRAVKPGEKIYEQDRLSQEHSKLPVPIGAATTAVTEPAEERM